jgi:hypothetical protein
MPRTRLLVLAVLIAALAFPGVAAAQPIGTAFTYQGRLTDAGSPANGTYDFRFTLYDAATGGAAVGTPVTANGVAVAEGLFASLLDFGPAAFAGQARWVLVEVRPAGGGTYTPLAPRQPLTPAPYSLFSSTTDPANLTILNAGNLTSGTVPGARLSGTYSLALNLSNVGNTINGTFTGVGSGLTGLNASNLATGTVPGPRLAGTYPNPVTFPSAGNVFAGDGSGLTNLNAEPRYLRTVVVRPVGSNAQNGAALLAALSGITTASSTNPWLIKVEPGIYDVGPTSLLMKPFVDIEGSGEAVTRITGTGQASNVVGTVHAVTNTELRHITVESRGGDAYAKALFVDGGSPRITNVTCVAFGATVESQGFFAQNNATPTVRHLNSTGIAAGSANSFGVINLGAAPTYFDLNAFASGGNFAIAVGSYNGASPTIRSAVEIASGATTENQGFASGAASPTMENVVGIATGPAVNDLGCLNFSSPSAVFVRNAICRGIGATGTNHGMLNNTGANVNAYDVVAEGIGGQYARGLENNGSGGGTSLTSARVSASNGSTDTSGLLNVGVSPRIVDVEAYASGQGNAYVQAIGMTTASSLLSRVTATAAGQTGTVVGMGIYANASPTLEHVSVTANGGNVNYGIFNNAGGTSRPLLREVTVNSIEGAAFTAGLYNLGGGSISVTDVVASSTSTNGIVVGVWTDDVTTNLTNVTASATGGTSRYGLANGQGTATTVTVDRCTLSGSTASVITQSNSTTRVAGSKLAGPVTTVAGSTASCLFSYNGSFGAVNAACQ